MWVRALSTSEMLRLALLAELVAEARCELEAAGAAADDDDVVQAARVAHRHHLRCPSDGSRIVHRIRLFPERSWKPHAIAPPRHTALSGIAHAAPQ